MAKQSLARYKGAEKTPIYKEDTNELIGMACPKIHTYCLHPEALHGCHNCPYEEKPEREFVKKDSGKLKWSLLPFEELKDVVRVLMHGAEKYSVDNWKKCDDTTRYKDALMRHVVAYVSGEKTDEEFGLSHLAHAMCNCLFLMWFDKHKEDKND